MGREKIIKKLNQFKTALEKDFKIKKMILFGSRAIGKTGKDIDVDLIIVSPDFINLNFFKRGAKMYNYWELNYPVDFLCYTPEEFDRLKNKITIINEALKKGIEIK